jgi:hypothetical protein
MIQTLLDLSAGATKAIYTTKQSNQSMRADIEAVQKPGRNATNKQHLWHHCCPNVRFQSCSAPRRSSLE